MKKRILRYLKHIFTTISVLFAIAVAILLTLNGNIYYDHNPVKRSWVKEGPYVFFENDSIISVNHITGNKKDGLRNARKEHRIGSGIKTSSYLNLDGSHYRHSQYQNPKNHL